MNYDGEETPVYQPEEEEMKVQMQIKEIFNRSMSNKKDFFENIKKLIIDGSDEVWEEMFESIYKQLFEMLKDDDWEIKD